MDASNSVAQIFLNPQVLKYEHRQKWEIIPRNRCKNFGFLVGGWVTSLCCTIALHWITLHVCTLHFSFSKWCIWLFFENLFQRLLCFLYHAKDISAFWHSIWGSDSSALNDTHNLVLCSISLLGPKISFLVFFFDIFFYLILSFFLL